MLIALWKKWAWLIGLVLMAAAFYLLGAVYGEVRSETLRRWSSQQLTLADKIGNGVRGFFRQIQGTLSYLANNDHVIELDQRGMDLMSWFVAFQEASVKAITRIDAKGRIIHTWPPNPRVLGQDISDQEHNAYIIAHHQPLISDVFMTVQGYPAVAILVPVFRHGEYHGCISAVIPFATIAASFLGDLGTESGKFAWMLSQKGKLIFVSPQAPQLDFAAPQGPDASLAALKQLMMQGKSGELEFSLVGAPGSVGPMGYRAVYTPVVLSNTFWSLAIAAPEVEILAVMRGFTIRWWGIVAVLVVLGVLASYYGIKAWAILSETKKRERAEEALRESEQRYKSLFDSALDAFFIIDSEKVVDCNPSCCKIFGCKREELVGRHPAELSPTLQPDGDSSREKADRLEVLVMAGQPQQFFWQHLRPDGSLFDAEVLLNRVELAGQPYTLAMMRDVTERRRAERELAQSEARLREAQAMAHVGSWELNLATGEMWGSEEALAIFGLDPSSSIISMDQIRSQLHPDDREVNARKLAALILQDQNYDNEFRICRADNGAVRHIHSTAKVERNTQGKALHLSGTLQDITEQKLAREEKARLEMQLRQSQKMESLGTLARGIAHDFNNILSAVMGQAELALLKHESGQPLERNLREVLAAGNRAKDLVGQILAFSRQTEPELKPMQLDRIVEDTVKLLRSSLPASMAIQTRINCPGATIMANATQIHQVLMNLCVNGAAAMEPGGGMLTLSLSQVELQAGDRGFPLVDLPPGRYVILTVSDTGGGMPPEVKDKIFEPYFTTKKPGEGTGLGLAVVHGIIRDHGGAISVYSELGQGSTFKVYLPQVEESSLLNPAGETEEDPTGQERILVVDDEEVLTEVAQGLLESLGYQVESHNSSLKALAKFQEDPMAFDLVVTDLNMPQMDGQELSREMLRQRPDLPIIIYTGFSRHLSSEDLTQLGVRKLLIKPVVKRDLALAVREALDEEPK